MLVMFSRLNPMLICAIWLLPTIYGLEAHKLPFETGIDNPKSKDY